MKIMGRKFNRRQKRRLKKILRNSMIRGSVLGAMVMLAAPSRAMESGSLPAKVMCLAAGIYLMLFMGANYCIPYYDGHYHLIPKDPGEEKNVV